MIRLIGLDQHPSRLFRAPRPSRCLCQELEGSLRSPEIRYVQRKIRCENPHQRHIREIMSLDDHLRPDQDVRLMRCEF